MAQHGALLSPPGRLTFWADHGPLGRAVAISDLCRPPETAVWERRGSLRTNCRTLVRRSKPGARRRRLSPNDSEAIGNTRIQLCGTTTTPTGGSDSSGRVAQKRAASLLVARPSRSRPTIEALRNLGVAHRDRFVIMRHRFARLVNASSELL